MRQLPPPPSERAVRIGRAIVYGVAGLMAAFLLYILGAFVLYATGIYTPDRGTPTIAQHPLIPETKPEPPKPTKTWREPGEACSYLAEQGIPTGSYKHIDQEQWHCISTYIEIGAPSPGVLATDFAYYVIGTEKRVMEVYLALNVNDKTTAKEGLAALLKSAESLSQKAFQRPLSEAIKEALAKKKSFKEVISPDMTIEAKADIWSTGKGYSLNLYFYASDKPSWIMD